MYALKWTDRIDVQNEKNSTQWICELVECSEMEYVDEHSAPWWSFYQLDSCHLSIRLAFDTFENVFELN